MPLALGTIPSGCAPGATLPLPSLVVGLVATRRAPGPAGATTPANVVGLLSLVLEPRTIAGATNLPDGAEDEATTALAEMDPGGSRDATLAALERRAVALALSRWLAGPEGEALR